MAWVRGRRSCVLTSHRRISGCRYEGRGLFLEPPSMGLSDGVWRIRLPAAMQDAVPPSALAFATRDELYDRQRWAPPLIPRSAVLWCLYVLTG